jgi:hypothetical protein
MVANSCADLADSVGFFANQLIGTIALGRRGDLRPGTWT